LRLRREDRRQRTEGIRHKAENTSATHLSSDFIRPFDLSGAPLLRVGLVKLPADSTMPYLLMVDMHHIITDGMSMEIFINEFKALYTGETLPPLKVQYKDFSQWQDSEKEKQVIKKQEAYWLTRFEDEVSVLEMPVDYPRPVVRSDQGSTISFEISAEEKKVILTKGRHFFPMGDKFVGTAGRRENNTLLRTFNIYDAEFKKIKEFFYLKREIQPGKGRKPFDAPFGLGVCNNRIFIAFQTDFVINVFNLSGEKLFTIKEDYERIKLTDDHKKAAYKWFKEASRGNMRTFEFLKRESVFPDYLPGFRGLSVMDNKVCVRTYKYCDNKLEFYFYDCSGKFLGKKISPILCHFTLIGASPNSLK
jgi:hypothetical protein